MEKNKNQKEKETTMEESVKEKGIIKAWVVRNMPDWGLYHYIVSLDLRRLTLLLIDEENEFPEPEILTRFNNYILAEKIGYKRQIVRSSGVYLPKDFVVAVLKDGGIKDDIPLDICKKTQPSYVSMNESWCKKQRKKGKK